MIKTDVTQCFQFLARRLPSEFVAWINSEVLKPSTLTFAAEALCFATSEIAVPCLLNLLQHKSSSVREGAVYGLEGHLDYPRVREVLNEVAQTDSNPGVQMAATEALEVDEEENSFDIEDVDIEPLV